MSDHLDKELRQQIKEASARSLEGWEFTPQMRRAVLDRIAQEEALPATPVPASRPRPALTRPIAWVASAAAVLFLSFSMVPKLGDLVKQGAKSVPGDLASGSGPAPAAAARLTAQEEQDQIAPRGGGEPAPEGKLRALTDNQAPSVAEPTPPQGSGQELYATDTLGETSPTTRMMVADPPPADLPTDPAADGEGMAVAAALPPQAPARIQLTEPEVGIAAYQVREDEGEQIGQFGIASAPITVDLRPLPTGQIALTTAFAVTVMDPAGQVVAEQPLAGHAEQVLSAPTGEMGILAGSQIALFDQTGAPAGALTLPTAPMSAALGPNLSVAVLDEAGLTIHRTDGKAITQPIKGSGKVTVAADGTVAAFLQASGGRTLHLVAVDGKPLLNLPVGAGGEALAFVSAGQHLVAGQQLFDRSGRLIAELTIEPQGVTALGTTDLLAWNQHEVSRFKAADGSERWRAEYATGAIRQVTLSANGEQIAILGENESGERSVWVLDANGDQRYAERLAEPAQQAVVSGEHLHLLTGSGTQVRPLPRP